MQKHPESSLSPRGTPRGTRAVALGFGSSTVISRSRAWAKFTCHGRHSWVVRGSPQREVVGGQSMWLVGWLVGWFASLVGLLLCLFVCVSYFECGKALTSTNHVELVWIALRMFTGVGVFFFLMFVVILKAPYSGVGWLHR